MTLVVVTMRMKNFLGLSSYGNRINSSHLGGSAWFFTKAVRLWESGAQFPALGQAGIPWQGRTGCVPLSFSSLLHPISGYSPGRGVGA